MIGTGGALSRDESALFRCGDRAATNGDAPASTDAGKLNLGEIMNGRILGLLGAAIIATLSGTASAQSTLTVKATNNTPVTTNISSPSGCQGVNTLGNLTSGQSLTSNITSPYSTSNGCSIRYTRTDNSRYCNWVLSRTRSSLNGPWNYPTISTTKSSSGVTCTSTITSVNTNGNWSVSLTIAP